MNKENFLISQTTKRKPKSLRFEQMKNTVLGEKYSLSVVFVGDKKIRALNRIYREKDYATDILSFPISNDIGEIYLCENIISKKAKDFERTKENYLEFVFVHGLVHLLGFDHGEKMEKKEETFRKLFKI